MPGVFYTSIYGEQNSTYASAGNANLGRFPLGHKLILPDGREYMFALNDGTVEVAGNVYQSVAPVANHTNRSADVARAIGAVALSATLAATAAATDIYAEGLAHINDLTGEGYSHRIARAMTSTGAHASAAASAVLTVNLAAGESVQVALTTASEMSFTRNRFHQPTLALSPPTAGLAGVSPGVAALDRFYWSQVRGMAAVLADGTLLAGLPVQLSTSIDGAVENLKRRIRTGGATLVVLTSHFVAPLTDQDGTTTGAFLYLGTASATTGYDITGPIAVNSVLVGVCVKANADTEFALIELHLPNN